MQLILLTGGFAVFVLLYGYILSHFIPKRFYSYLNILMALGSIAFGKLLGLSFTDMGIDINAIKNGILFGAILVIPIALVITIVLMVPRLRHFFTDQPAQLNGWREISYELGFRIPFGTAFSEEILFRAVLLGLLLASYSDVVAIVISSIIFGLWHIAPTWKTLRKNLALKEFVGNQKSLHGLSVLGAVLSTAAAGVVFAVLRIWSGSVVAAWIVHCSFNGFSIIGGIIAHKLHVQKSK